MSEHSVLLDTVEESGLSEAVALVNQEIQAKYDADVKANPDKTIDPPELKTNDTYLLERAKEWTRSYARQRSDSLLTKAITAFSKASDTDRAAVLGILGLSVYSSLPVPALIPILKGLGPQAVFELPKDKQGQLFTLLKLGV